MIVWQVMNESNALPRGWNPHMHSHYTYDLFVWWSALSAPQFSMYLRTLCSMMVLFLDERRIVWCCEKYSTTYFHVQNFGAEGGTRTHEVFTTPYKSAPVAAWVPQQLELHKYYIQLSNGALNEQN